MYVTFFIIIHNEICNNSNIQGDLGGNTNILGGNTISDCEKNFIFTHFESWFRQKESWRSAQTNNTRSSHESCKVLWVWRWGFRTFIKKCNRLVISVYQNCHWKIKSNLKLNFQWLIALSLLTFTNDLCLYIQTAFYR